MATSLAHVGVLLRDLFDDPQGIILGRFDPLYITLRVGTLVTEPNLQTIQQNINTKHCDTLV